MPTVSIEMFSGRTRSQKADLVVKVTDAVVDALGVQPDVVKVKLYEIAPHHSGQGGVLASDRPGVAFDPPVTGE